MDILMVPVPLFDEENQVSAYMFKYSKGNTLLSAAKDSIHFDGAMKSPILQTVATVGLEALTMGKPVFVPVSKYMLMAKLDEDCTKEPEKIVFLVDADSFRSEAVMDSASRLKGLGHRIAAKGMKNDPGLVPALELCDYVLHEHKQFSDPGQAEFRALIAESYPGISNVYVGVDSMEVFQSARKKHKGLYEGRFYSMPLSEGAKKVSPMQVNMINLLNKVRSDSFDFDEVAEVIQKDPALTLSLLRMVNTIGRRESGVEIKSINGAVVMLGQEEVRKWITAATANQLGADKPSEVAKLSLVRAKFAEDLALVFGLGDEKDSLFLMGVFSVLDAMLEMPMAEALKLVLVSSDIEEALISKTGRYGNVYKFMLDYEAAEWDSVSRMMIINDVNTTQVYRTYTEALCWYRDMLGADVDESEPAEDE